MSRSSAPILRPTRPAPQLVAVIAIIVGLTGPARAEPPHATVDVRALAADPDGPAAGRWVPMLEPDTGLPYRLADPVLTFAVDRQVIDVVGLAPVREGLTVLNGTVGSALDVTVHGPSTPDASPPAAWRVVLDPCRAHRDLAHADLRVDHRDERGAWVTSAAIILCTAGADLTPRRLSALMAHELGHVLGLGHLCRSTACRRTGQRPDPCGYMFPSTHPCQDPTAIAAVVAALYPSSEQ